MRQIRMFQHVTADGFFARPDGSLDWVVHDEEIAHQSIGKMPEADTVLFGRTTYEMFARVWPAMREGVPGPHGAPSPTLLAMAKFLNDATKLVFSRTLKQATWRGTRIVRELDPRELAAMKQGPGKDMLLFGSGSIASQLVQHGLVDAFELVVAPILLGRGRPILDGVTRSTELALVGSQAFASGKVMLRYARAE